MKNHVSNTKLFKKVPQDPSSVEFFARNFYPVPGVPRQEEEIIISSCMNWHFFFLSRKSLRKRLTSLSLSESLMCWAMKRTDWIAASTSDVSIRGMIICSPSVKAKKEAKSSGKGDKRREGATCLVGDADWDDRRIHRDYPCIRWDIRWCCPCNDPWKVFVKPEISIGTNRNFTSCPLRWYEFHRRIRGARTSCDASSKRVAWIAKTRA